MEGEREGRDGGKMEGAKEGKNKEVRGNIERSEGTREGERGSEGGIGKV